MATVGSKHPSMGEGWGMTLSEAMSTGMPCIATSMTGTADFFDKKVGYPIDYRFQKIEFRNYDFESNVCVAKPSHTFHQLNEVHLNYKQALNRGKKARKRLVENFSWEQSGRRLFEILKALFTTSFHLLLSTLYMVSVRSITRCTYS